MAKEDFKAKYGLSWKECLDQLVMPATAIEVGSGSMSVRNVILLF